jgi:hypothetical protein
MHIFTLESFANIETYQVRNKLTDSRGDVIMQGADIVDEICAFFRAFDYLAVEYEIEQKLTRGE